MTKRLGRHVVLGMAGHIDHGKTELVKALTGTDTDRLKEEKERGMTTDLGFAFLGDDITIIDVPGHEKFVKTMVAGVNTVDVALLVIAADDGIMPQTVEHLEILNLLRVPAGLIAVTKTDMVEQEWLELVITDIRNLIAGTVLEGAPIVPVSSITGDNIDRLTAAIVETAASVRRRQDRGVFRMPVDRVFTIKGFGTVVAGTVLSGTIHRDAAVELLPQQKRLRVRGIQVHDQSVEQGGTGFRTAINLQNVEKTAIIRGNVLAEPGFYRPTTAVDAHFSLLQSWQKVLKNRTRVRVHVGTSEVMGRIILLEHRGLEPGKEGFVQVRFEKPVVADRDDRFVVRSYSPVRTLGGGVVLDPHPPRHKRFDPDVSATLQRFLQGDPVQVVEEFLQRAGYMPMNADEIATGLGMPADQVQRLLDRLEESGEGVRIGKKRWMAAATLAALKRAVLDELDAYYENNPLRISMSGAEIRSRIRRPVDKALFDSTCALLVEEGVVEVDGDKLKRAGRDVSLPAAAVRLKEKIEAAYLADPWKPPRLSEVVSDLGKEAEPLISFLLESGTLVRLENEILIHGRALADAKEKIAALLDTTGGSTVSDIKELLGTTRKYAMPLCIHLDNTGFTERDGDLRILKR
ncbi:selenocysteine-specific translation elongation factor [bacterium]|nr:selenocysteine-specific translation elongation factor [bacterium]